jgi:hypothetical protein
MKIVALILLLASPVSAKLVTRIVKPVPPPAPVVITEVVVSTAADAKINSLGTSLLQHAEHLLGVDMSLLRMHARIESVKTERSIADEEPKTPAPFFGPEAEVGIAKQLMPMYREALARVDAGSLSVEDMGTVLATYTTLGQSSKAKAFCSRMLKRDEMPTNAMLWLNKRCRGS